MKRIKLNMDVKMKLKLPVPFNLTGIYFALRYPALIGSGIKIANDVINPAEPIPSTTKGTYGSLVRNIFEQ